jgi:hypothetical protein
MASLTIFLVCLAPGSDVGAPTTDFAVNLRLASSTTHAPLSSQWAMSYYQAPRLIGTPAPIDEPTMTPTQLATDLNPIGPEPLADEEVELLWHDWSMKDMSLEWGLATIGPGVLAPQMGGVSGRPGGGGPGGGGQGQPSPGFLFVPPTTPTPRPPPGPNVQPVPEASAMFTWLILMSALILGVNRWNKPPALAVSPAAA